MRSTLDEHLLETKEENTKREKWHYVLLIILLVGYVISTVIAWYEVETIVGSGPIMSILGIIFSRIAYTMNYKSSVFLGLIPFAISIFWFIMIDINSLSPSDCQVIVPISLSVATVLAFIIGLKFISNRNLKKF